jgi:hypothetical protein
MAFTKYNNPNKKRIHRRPTRQEAETFAIKTMLDHKANGIELSSDFYASLARKNETGKWDKE